MITLEDLENLRIGERISNHHFTIKKCSIGMFFTDRTKVVWSSEGYTPKMMMECIKSNHSWMFSKVYTTLCGEGDK